MSIDITQANTLLGGLSPEAFMRDYWQKKPLLIRQAIPNFKPPIGLVQLKQLAKQDQVESRLIWREKDEWNLEQGPFDCFPTLRQKDWTLLVQSVDLHNDDIAELMQRFRFIPDSRLDDVMISFASMGGGVGPHFDSYDVFLLQGVGQRQWRISEQKDLRLIPNLPCKILQHFEVEQEFILEPGDMLYLPPHVAHDGISLSKECMTISIGFRSQTLANLARGMMEAAADQLSAQAGMGYGTYSFPPLKTPNLKPSYKDPQQKATNEPARIPQLMIKKTLQVAQKVTFDRTLAARFLGVSLSEPNQLAVFESTTPLDFNLLTELPQQGKIILDRKTRILYTDEELYINGEVVINESLPLLQKLANERYLSIEDLSQMSTQALEVLQDWLDSGWAHWIKRCK